MDLDGEERFRRRQEKVRPRRRRERSGCAIVVVRV